MSQNNIETNRNVLLWYLKHEYIPLKSVTQAIEGLAALDTLLQEHKLKLQKLYEENKMLKEQFKALSSDGSTIVAFTNTVDAIYAVLELLNISDLPLISLEEAGKLRVSNVKPIQTASESI